MSKIRPPLQNIKNILMVMAIKSSKRITGQRRQGHSSLNYSNLHYVLCWAPAVILLGLPAPVLAIQVHGVGEGLYVHQGAHLFFLFSMASVACRLCRSPLSGDGPWRLMSWGAWLLVAWNFWTFTGHIVELFISEEQFLPRERSYPTTFRVDSWISAVYYILKMDHLLCVPALFFFYAGLREMLVSPPRTGSGQ